jgi:hypothetical protein
VIREKQEFGVVGLKRKDPFFSANIVKIPHLRHIFPLLLSNHHHHPKTMATPNAWDDAWEDAADVSPSHQSVVQSE